MKTFPSDEDIHLCLERLHTTYKVPDRIIKNLFSKENYTRLNRLLQSLDKEKIDMQQLAKMLIVEKGAELFSGSSAEVRELRSYLLKQLSEEDLVDLYSRNPVANKTLTSPAYMVTPLAKKRWTIGSRWPRDFMKTLGFPAVFAGVSLPNTASSSAVVDIEPRKKVPPLVDFQRKLKEQMFNVLALEGEYTRCIVTLPTGGGKTRVAVESFIEWMHSRFNRGKYFIWIAQSEELCEQAITCITDMWQEKDYPESLRVYRYFAGNEIAEEQLMGGAVVASIQQLNSRLKNDDPVLTEIIRDCGAMIIDEAHHAAAKTYHELLTKAEDICGPKLFPICGLTATPGRSDGETGKLVNRFEAHLLQPELTEDPAYEQDPLQYFREQGYLAKPKHIIYDSGREYAVNEQDVEVTEAVINAELLDELANDEWRNVQMMKRLQEIPARSQTLVYACTVNHAEYLATVMNALGRKAAAISAETPKATRRIYIDAFKNGEVEFLFNYGVLTTGFDAPKTEYIVICRPTTSVVLYEQIVGRGLRGPRFGGTEYCTIIDFADNLHRLGKPLAYARFQHFWHQEEVSSIE